MAEKKKGRPSRFRFPKVHLTNTYWLMKLFHLLQNKKQVGFKKNSGLAAAREMKELILDPVGLFKDFELQWLILLVVK